MRRYPRFLFNNLSSRFIGYLIDSMLIRVFNNMIFQFGRYYGLEKSSAFLSPYNLITMTVFLGYFVLCTKFTNGYTIGRAIMGVRVVSFEEDQLSWATVLTRELCGGFINYQFYFLNLLPLFTEYKQNTGDLLADTGVLKESHLKEFEEKYENGPRQLEMEF